MTEAQRVIYTQKIVEAVASWQRSLGEQLKDDARGRAAVEMATVVAQRDLITRGELPEDLPQLEVRWEKQYGISTPMFSFPPDPLTPAELAHREAVIAEGRAMLERQRELVEQIEARTADVARCTQAWLQVPVEDRSRLLEIILERVRGARGAKELADLLEAFSAQISTTPLSQTS